MAGKSAREKAAPVAFMEFMKFKDVSNFVDWV